MLLLFDSYIYVIQADENRDGVLSLTEMINNDYLFYNTVDEGLDEGVHDEF